MRQCHGGAFGGNRDRKRFKVRGRNDGALEILAFNKVLRHLRRREVFLCGVEDYAGVVVRGINLNVHEFIEFIQSAFRFRVGVDRRAEGERILQGALRVALPQIRAFERDAEIVGGILETGEGMRSNGLGQEGRNVAVHAFQGETENGGSDLNDLAQRLYGVHRHGNADGIRGEDAETVLTVRNERRDVFA